MRERELFAASSEYRDCPLGSCPAAQSWGKTRAYGRKHSLPRAAAGAGGVAPARAAHALAAGDAQQPAPPQSRRESANASREIHSCWRLGVSEGQLRPPPRGPKAGERSSAIPRLSLQAAGGAPWPLTERPLRLRPGQGGGLPSLPHAPWLPHLALCPQPHLKHPSSSVLLIPSSPLGPEHTPHRPLVFPNQVSLHPK